MNSIERRFNDGSEIDLVARLLAFESGKALRVASHLHVSLQPHALVVCPLAMAARTHHPHRGNWACWKAPEFRSVPDPRFREDEYGSSLGSRIGSWRISMDVGHGRLSTNLGFIIAGGALLDILRTGSVITG